jgi:hypothetical protein
LKTQNARLAAGIGFSHLDRGSRVRTFALS